MLVKKNTLLLLLLFALMQPLSAQTLPFLKGEIELNNGSKLSGYLSVINSTKIAFKPKAEQRTIRLCRAKEVQRFRYGKEKYVSITERYSTFFVREIAKGETALYKRDFSPNANRVYYLKSETGFCSIEKNNFYENMKQAAGESRVFQLFDEKMFHLAFDYNEVELTALVHDFNAENLSKSRLMDFNTDSLGDGAAWGFINSEYSKLGAGDDITKIPNTMRGSLQIKSDLLYAEMLLAIENENWERVNKMLALLKPLAAEIEAFSETSAYDNIKKYASLNQKDKCKQAFVLFVSQGVQHLINTASFQEHTTIRRIALRQAFIEFLVINSELQRLNTDMEKRIIEQFRVTFAHANSKELFSPQAALLQSNFKSITARI